MKEDGKKEHEKIDGESGIERFTAECMRCAVGAELQRDAQGEEQDEREGENEEQVDPSEGGEREGVFGEMREGVLLQNGDIGKDGVEHGQEGQDGGGADGIGDKNFFCGGSNFRKGDCFRKGGML